jgi:hypothetical protein
VQFSVERFETGEMWVKRLEKAGFPPTPIQPDSIQDFCPQTIQLEKTPDYLAFSVQENPIVSIISATG